VSGREGFKKGLWESAGIRFTGFGAYHPREIRHNTPQAVGDAGNSVDAAVLGDISVRSRHVSAEDETIPFMAAQAGKRAMLDAALEPTDLDLVVLSNWTTPAYTPDHAPQAAALMGAPAPSPSTWRPPAWVSYTGFSWPRCT
jgi:3-oxoacyl-[acyl-carrier-protein] synthase-3